MHARTWITVGTVLSGLTLAGCTGDEQEPVSVGLITKQEENPYWVSMRDVAQETADELDVDLITATGTSDTDVASQEAALADMVADGVDGILIAPTDPVALLPSIQEARDAGVLVIALDTPVDPPVVAGGPVSSGHHRRRERSTGRDQADFAAGAR